MKIHRRSILTDLTVFISLFPTGSVLISKMSGTSTVRSLRKNTRRSERCIYSIFFWHILISGRRIVTIVKRASNVVVPAVYIVFDVVQPCPAGEEPR